MNKNEIVVTEEGYLVKRSVSEVYLNEDAERTLLSQALKNYAFLTPNLLTDPEREIVETRALFVPSAAGNFFPTIGLRINRLVFKTSWSKTEDGYWVPAFDPAGAQVDPLSMPDGAFVFRPPEFLKLWFVATPKSRAMPDVSLIAQFQEEEGGEYRLATMPLSNVFADGRCCIGSQNTSEYPQHFGPVPLVLNSLHQWEQAPWNLDLMDDDKRKAIKETMRFDANGIQVPASRETWASAIEYASPGSHSEALKFFQELKKEETDGTI